MNNEEKILGLLEKINENVENLTGRVAALEVTNENIIVPQLQALAEGIDTIDRKLITRSEFDAMKEEVAFLKDIVRMHTSQINDLKKAE